MGTLTALLERVNRRPFGWIETQFYETMASASVVKLIGPVILEQLTAAAGTVGDPPRALDVGCGSGAIAQWISEQSSTPTWGVDPSIAQMRRVARLRPPRVGAAATAEALPFQDSSFDAVVSSCSVKHWVDRAAGLGECERVLRPDGVLVLAEIDGGEHPDDLLRFAAASRVPRGLHQLYRSFARRSFVPVSPTTGVVTEELAELGMTTIAYQRVPQLPFFVVTARRAA